MKKEEKKEKVRILEVFGDPVLNGGQESFVINVLNHMDLSGLAVDVLTPYECENKRYEKMIRMMGGNMIALNMHCVPGKSRHEIYRPLLKFLKANPYDVVHVHSGSMSVLALTALAAKRNHVRRIIVHSHCAASRKTVKYRLVRTVMAPILDRCATDFFACSQVAGNWKFSSKAQRKMRILKNGVDLNLFRFSLENRLKIREKYGVKDETFVIGHVGRFCPQKNHEYLIDLYSKILKKVPDSLLMLVGEGDLKPKAVRKASDLGVESHVLFCGDTDRIQEYYSAMDAFVLPSLFEGLPLVGVEAQANGLAVIASDRVSKELSLTDLVTYIPLDNEEQWIRTVVETKGKSRKDTLSQLREAGYDIDKTAAELRNEYLRI